MKKPITAIGIDNTISENPSNITDAKISGNTIAIAATLPCKLSTQRMLRSKHRGTYINTVKKDNFSVLRI